ncbi:MAG: hypothetical protein L3J09_06420 [Flavobacteriaceae bacterium]|nr:hypothetical protein [Flavobacteriaceae bacterium]
MRKITFLLFFTSLLVTAQEENTKIKLHSFSVTPLNVYVNSNAGGISLGADLVIKKDKHLVKLTLLGGGEINISTLGPSRAESFYEIDLLYGREIRLKKRLFLDIYGGIGYFNQVISTPEKIPGSGSSSSGFGGFSFGTSEYENNIENNITIGLPLQSRIRFQTGRRFSVGLQLHANLNLHRSIYNIGPFLQWNLQTVSDFYCFV